MVKSAEESAETLARSEGREPEPRSEQGGAGEARDPGTGDRLDLDADGPTEIPPTGWKDVLKRTWKEASEDHLELIAAGVAFYGFLALIPLLTSVVLSYGIFAEPAAVAGHIAALASMVPEQAADIIGSQLENMVETANSTAGIALLTAIGIALYSAQRGADAIITALNIIYEVGETRSFLRKLAISLAITLGAVMVFMFASFAISALGYLEALLPDLGGVVHTALQIGFWAGAAAVVSLVIAIIYRYAPNRKQAKWRWISPGSAVATVVWLAATAAFGFYVSNFGSYNATYGSLGAVIVFLTWIYLSAYILLLGAELNAELSRQAGGSDKEEQ